MNLLFIEETLETSVSNPDKPYRKKSCLFNGSDATSFSVSEHGIFHKLTLPKWSQNLFGDLTIMTDVGDVLFEYKSKVKDRPRIREIKIPEGTFIQNIVFRLRGELLLINIVADKPDECRSYASIYPSVRDLIFVGNWITRDPTKVKYGNELDLNNLGVHLKHVSGETGLDLPTATGSNYFTLDEVVFSYGMRDTLTISINEITSIKGLFVELTEKDLEAL